jgi:hypothetical protein
MSDLVRGFLLGWMFGVGLVYAILLWARAALTRSGKL